MKFYEEPLLVFKLIIEAHLHDTQIEDVECFKYLGIRLECKLNFQQRIYKVKNKILQFCGVFFHLRKFLTGWQLKFAYKSYVQPIIQYGVLVYANTDKTKLLELEMKIRRLIRIIFYKHRMDSITDIMHENKINTVREFFAYEVLKLTGKIIRKECQVDVKLCNKFFPAWVIFLNGASRFQLNSFNRKFLDNYILGNTVLLCML